MSAFPQLRLRRAGGLLDLRRGAAARRLAGNALVRELPVRPSPHLVPFLVVDGILIARRRSREVAEREYAEREGRDVGLERTLAPTSRWRSRTRGASLGAEYPT